MQPGHRGRAGRKVYLDSLAAADHLGRCGQRGPAILSPTPQLTSSRPGGGDPSLAGNTFDDQTIDARLWQDPLGVAKADQEKVKKQDEQTHDEVHSLTQFQGLLLKKCFTIASAPDPLANELPSAGEAKQVQIIAVMIPGGPYVEDVERRLRSRRAVIEGLGIAGYGPEKDHEIGYFRVPWLRLQPDVATCVTTLEQKRKEDERAGDSTSSWNRPAGGDGNRDTLLVPYEWCEPATFRTERRPLAHVLVLWLTDDAFRDAPVARLADLISWFRLKPSTISGEGDLSALPNITVLGPDNSGTLHSMVLEAKEDPWNDETRQCLATTHIYSSQAFAAESQLLAELPIASGYGTCKDLIEQKMKRSRWSGGFAFDRTILLDNQIVKTLWEELKCHGVKWSDDVAIISEEDTYYARALSSSFMHPELGTIPTNVHAYTYLRGIDGKLPSDNKEEKETKATTDTTAQNNQSSLRPTEQTEGVNQADDLRRLAVLMQNLDIDLRKGGGEGLKAVGLLGSDVYDKLELLKALHPMIPEAVFFTNNLDARLAHPDEWKETHNLIVVSAHDLSLKGPYQQYQKVAPFRDSGQTALFEATLESMGKLQVEDAKPKHPFIFEIGRNGQRELSIPKRKDLRIPEKFHLAGQYLSSLGQLYFIFAFGNLFLAWAVMTSLIQSVGNLPPLLRSGCFVVLGALLFTWIGLVSRVTRIPAKAETKTGKKRKELFPTKVLDRGALCPGAAK